MFKLLGVALAVQRFFRNPLGSCLEYTGKNPPATIQSLGKEETVYREVNQALMHSNR